MTHPYRDIPDSAHWYRAVTDLAPGHVDPVLRAPIISPSDLVASMGSCFSQRLSQQITRSGFSYFVPEAGRPGLGEAAASAANYGVFSARYGNVYTVRQALQLFDRAFGHYQPEAHIWEQEGRYVDGFRPQIEPGGFASPQELLADRAHHLSCVRRVFCESDWLILTLGMTETWSSKSDGAVFPLAPGVAGGRFDPEQHEFVNFSVGEVIRDLQAFILRLKSVNPDLKTILTVSPVSPVATYEARHILVSASATKAILRTAADEIERNHENVVYFPSYEMITNPSAEGRYYADDLRQVNDLGVRLVMKRFQHHFLEANPYPPSKASPDLVYTARGGEELVCDEEEILKAIAQSGL